MPWLCLFLLGTSQAARSGGRPIAGRPVNGLRCQLLKQQAVESLGSPMVLMLRLVNEGAGPVGLVAQRDAFPEVFVELGIENLSGHAIPQPPPEARRPEPAEVIRVEAHGQVERRLTLPLLSKGTYLLSAVFHQHVHAFGGRDVTLWDGDVASNTLTVHIIPVKTQPKR